MRVSVRAVIGLSLLIAIAGTESQCAGQAAVKVVRVKALPEKPKDAGVDAHPADALKPANSDAEVLKEIGEQARKKRAVEKANAERVVAPLRALFGGAVEAPAAVMVAEEQQADVDAQNDAMTQQFVLQLHPILRSELGFVRLVCPDLTLEQRPKIRKPAEAALKEAARQLAKQQNQMQRGIAQRNNPTEASKLIREAILKALKETLSEQQFIRYSDEAAQRRLTRKRAAILSLVSRLDGQLYLTTEQRDKITESISSKWQDNWEKWLTMMTMYGDRYFPTVPDQCITPFLNTEQKVVWQSIQKIEFGAWWGGGMAQNLDTDGWWGDEPVNNAADVNGAVIFNLAAPF